MKIIFDIKEGLNLGREGLFKRIHLAIISFLLYFASTGQMLIAKPRVIIMTDISSLSQTEGEPDDGQSLIRLLLYANELEIQGFIATSNLRHGQTVRPELIRQAIETYGKVQPNLLRHDSAYPPASYLMTMIVSGQPIAGRNVPYDQSIGEGKDTEGSEWIIKTVDLEDTRPLWILIWGGSADLAQALWKVQKMRSPEQLAEFIAKIRVDAVYNQDATSQWIQHEFPNLFYMIRNHGIRGMYRGGDTSLTDSRWVNLNIKNHGILGDLYVDYDGGDIWSQKLGKVKGIKEGDTPTFLGLIPNGLNDKSHPEWGGWGARFTKVSEGKNLWVESIDSIGNYLADPDPRMAALYRWRRAWQADFASRLDWCINPFTKANHAPVIENGTAFINADCKKKLRLKLTGVADADNDKLTYKWFFYKEEGSYSGPLPSLKRVGSTASLTLPAVNKNESLHIIAEISDDGIPSLSRYKRFIIHIEPCRK